jgi:hypothetical protein
LRHPRSLLATAALLLALGDPGLHSAVADALGVPIFEVHAYSLGITASLRSYLGPGISAMQVTIATAELLRLHRLAKAQENASQFVVVKFSSSRFGHIAKIADPIASALEFHEFMKVFYGCS